jgi:hypothetical protein
VSITAWAASRSRAAAARHFSTSLSPPSSAACWAFSSAWLALANARSGFGWASATTFSSHAAALGRFSFLTRSASSRSPSERSPFASSSRAATNSLGCSR